MALSQQKTTVAVLRSVLGRYHGREDIFAKLAERSGSWVKKVSAGHKPLSEEAARVLAAKTGINLEWLLGEKPARPVDAWRRPYNYALFESYKSSNESGGHRGVVSQLDDILPNVVAIGSAAGRKRMVSLYAWRLRDFLERCKTEFGFDATAHAEVTQKLKNSPLQHVSIADAVRDIHGTVMKTFDVSLGVPLEPTEASCSTTTNKKRSVRSKS